MTVSVRLPELGSPGARVSAWFAEPGERVFEGDRLVEVRLGPATFDVSAPATGVLRERGVVVGVEVATGQELGLIEIDPDEAW